MTCADHPLLPLKVEKPRLLPRGPRTTTCPIARPVELHSPSPVRRFLKAPPWLSKQEDVEFEVGIDSSRTRMGYNRSPHWRQRDGIENDSKLAFERPPPASTQYSFDSLSECCDLGIPVSNDQNAQDVVFETLKFADGLLKSSRVWEDSHGGRTKKNILLQWLIIHSAINLAFQTWQLARVSSATCR